MKKSVAAPRGERGTAHWIERSKGEIVHQQRRLRPLLVLLLVAAVAVLGLAWAMEAAGSESASPAADAGKVIYRVGWNGEPDNINPFIGYTTPAFEIWYLTYDSLVGYDPATLAPMKGEESRVSPPTGR